MPRPAEEVAEVRAEGRGSRDGVGDAPAHQIAQLAVDELAEELVLQRQQRADALTVLLAARVLARDARGAAEDGALAIGLSLLLGRVVDLLEHAGNSEQHRGLERAQRLDEVRGVGLVPRPDAGVDVQHRHEAREHVSRRDEQHGRGAGLIEDLAQFDGGVLRGVDEVAVRENAALRASHRSGRVDDGRDVVSPREVAASFDLGVIDLGALSSQLVEGPLIHPPVLADERQLVAHLGEPLVVPGVLYHECDGARV